MIPVRIFADGSTQGVGVLVRRRESGGSTLPN
jgi:hypothetical protein